MLNDTELKQAVINVLNHPTARDKQYKIGASQIGNPCMFCVARTLQGKKQRHSPFWLGARVGTAVHQAMEEGVGDQIDNPESGFEVFRDAICEKKITLGEIPGYGTITSKPDLVIPHEHHLIDYKTTKKDKVKHYQLEGVPEQYVAQQSLYAWGLGKSGIEIEKISLVFIARDGSGDRDIWINSWQYDESVAKYYWYRLESLWKWLQDGGDVNELASDPNCFYCNVILQRA